MRPGKGGLEVPGRQSAAHRRALEEVAARNDADHGDDFLALVLTGSVGRGVATAGSDLDVLVVLGDDAARQRNTTRSDDVDEVPVAISELDRVPRFGTAGWWFRWSYAWAPVVLDRTGGRVAAAARRMATVSPQEARSILLDHDRLDGWLNLAFRALKSHRDGRQLECRLDAAESVPWLLDVVFSLGGRVRPYQKYLPWELEHHPLPDWDGPRLLTLLTGTLDGDPRAIRETFTRVERISRELDPDLADVFHSWGPDLDHLRGP